MRLWEGIVEPIDEFEYSLGPIISAALTSSFCVPVSLTFISFKQTVSFLSKTSSILVDFIDHPKYSFSQMDFFKSIHSLLGVSRRPRPRPFPLESSALSKLPLELILHIARFLPPDSAPSFSLCCQPIYFILRTQYLKALEENEQLDRYKFLTLLERELPNYIACYLQEAPCN